MSEDVTTEKIEDKLSSIRYNIGCIQEDLQVMLDWIDKQMEERDRLDSKATEQAFDLLLYHGFNVGTVFAYEGVRYKITGICCNGFRIKRVSGKESRITLFPARDRDNLEKFLPAIKIVSDEGYQNTDEGELE